MKKTEKFKILTRKSLVLKKEMRMRFLLVKKLVFEMNWDERSLSQLSLEEKVRVIIKHSIISRRKEAINESFAATLLGRELLMENKIINEMLKVHDNIHPLSWVLWSEKILSIVRLEFDNFDFLLEENIRPDFDLIVVDGTFPENYRLEYTIKLIKALKPNYIYANFANKAFDAGPIVEGGENPKFLGPGINDQEITVEEFFSYIAEEFT